MNVNSLDRDNPRFDKIFWRPSRMPYTTFEELVSMAKESLLFARWSSGSTEVTGQEAAPLLVLLIDCALRYIGRGWTLATFRRIPSSVRR